MGALELSAARCTAVMFIRTTHSSLSVLSSGACDEVCERESSSPSPCPAG